MHPVVGGIAAIGDEGKVTGTLAALVTSAPSDRSMEEMSWELGEVPGRGDESSHRAAEARSLFASGSGVATSRRCCGEAQGVDPVQDRSDPGLRIDEELSNSPRAQYGHSTLVRPRGQHCNGCCLWFLLGRRLNRFLEAFEAI